MDANIVRLFGAATIVSLFGSGFTLAVAVQKKSRPMQIFCGLWALSGLLMLLTLSVAAVR
jgi:hypothetical protein